MNQKWMKTREASHHCGISYSRICKDVYYREENGMKTAGIVKKVRGNIFIDVSKYNQWRDKHRAITLALVKRDRLKREGKLEKKPFIPPPLYKLKGIDEIFTKSWLSSSARGSKFRLIKIP